MYKHQTIENIRKFSERAISVLVGAFALTIISAVSVPASALVINLDNWNINELNDVNGDFVEVIMGDDGAGNTTLTVQWMAGAGRTPGAPLATGIDFFLYNIVTNETDHGTDGVDAGEPGSVTSVFVGGSDVSGNWTPFNFDGTAADGFGDFNSHKMKDPAGTDGISATTALLFTLDGLVTLAGNSLTGARLVAHVRYGGRCSGWVADQPTTVLKSDSDCDVSVPEPATLGIFAFGLIALGFFARRRLAIA